MTRRIALAIAAALASAALGSPALGTTGSAETTQVELEEPDRDVGPGERFSFASTVRNAGDTSVPGLIAHLNIMTSDPDVYVDPEDWSSERTQYLDELPAGESTTLTWTVRAVDSGPLILYIAVSRPGTDRVVVSGPLEVTVTGRRVVNPGGVVPLVLATPGVVLALLGLTAVRRRLRR